MGKEKNFENKIKKYLEDKGCWFIKYWAGAAFTKEGIPDLLVCCDGRFIAIEVKRTNGKPSILQLYNLNKIDKAGGFGILLYPNMWEDFKLFIENPSNRANWYKKNLEIQEEWEKKLMKEGD